MAYVVRKPWNNNRILYAKVFYNPDETFFIFQIAGNTENNSDQQTSMVLFSNPADFSAGL